MVNKIIEECAYKDKKVEARGHDFRRVWKKEETKIQVVSCLIIAEF